MRGRGAAAVPIVVVAGSLAAAVVAPGVASAGTVAVSGGELRFEGAGSEDNQVSLAPVADDCGVGSLLGCEPDPRVEVRDRAAPLEPGEGCSRHGDAVRCDPGFDRVAALLGRGDDALTSDLHAPASVRGGPGADTVAIGAGEAYGEAGNDRLAGQGRLWGGGGDDVLRGTYFGAWLHGGGGADQLLDQGTADYRDRTEAVRVSTAGGADDGAAGEGDDVRTQRVEGGSGDDTLTGDDRQNQFLGGDGDDHIAGGGGGDGLSGGDGFDVVEGGPGSDGVTAEEGSGGPGDDKLSGDAGDERLSGDDGHDTFYATGGADRYAGGEGRDTLDYSRHFHAPPYDGGVLVTLDEEPDDGRPGEGDLVLPGVEILIGTRHDDSFVGSDVAEEFHLGVGTDRADGGGGDDRIFGSIGSDVILGGPGADLVDGGPGGIQPGDFSPDLLRGGPGNDHVVGAAGGDEVYGDDGDDRLDGYDGDDRVEGGAGQDALFGGWGDDVLIGGSASDRVSGYRGADTVRVAGDGSADVAECGDNPLIRFDRAFFDAEDQVALDCEERNPPEEG